MNYGTFAGRFDPSVISASGKRKIDFGGCLRPAGDANMPRVKKSRGAAEHLPSR
jgi:hypothetical protein